MKINLLFWLKKNWWRYFILEAPLRLTNLKNFSLGILEDALDGLLSRGNSLTPPMKLRLISGNYWSARFYRTMGKKYFSFCKKYCNLKKNSQILDIGCGCGQMAVQFVPFLNARGGYNGMDINKPEIEWCRKNISLLKSNFHFQQVNIFNQIYNPVGKDHADKYKFPFSKNSFDLIILISVFTHMIPKDMENYIREISRMLKKNGRVFITMFLLNTETKSLLKKNQSSIQFPYDFGTYRLLDKTNPACAVAYEEAYFIKLLQKNKLLLKTPIKYGSWRGGTEGWDNQDLILISRYQ